MGLPIPLVNASDTYVSEKYPEKNYGTAQRLYLADGSSADTRYGYIYFGVPSGMAGTTITSAKLRLYSGAGFAGSVTMSIQRLSARFSVNRVKWSNKPGVTGAVKQVTKNGAAAGTLWEYDVADVMQQVADGAAWYGFRISITGAAAKWIYSAQGASQYRPVLEIQWSDAPDTPETLIPDNGLAVSVSKPTLRWDFVDPAGDQTMQSANLRLFSSEALADANGAGDLLDVNVAATIPQWDLDDTAYGGLALDGQLWWRTQNVDGAGLLSGWSDPATFVRKSKGTLTITNPAADPNDFVTESTPPFSWTFTGRTQVKYQVILATPETPEKYIWNSGEITSTDTAVTPPANKLTEVGKTYRLIIRIWDDIDRVTVPDDPTYVEAFRDFTFDLDNTVDPVDNLTGDAHTYRSRWTLEWDDETAPDSYPIFRNGVQVDEVFPVDVLESGTHYVYNDDGARPRRNHVWSVGRKVNGKVSLANPTVNGLVKPITTTLSETDNDRLIYLFNPDVAAERTEESTIHYLLGEAPPVLITQNHRGYEGQVSGVLLNDTVPGVDAEDQLTSLEWFKDHPGIPLKLVWVDKVLKVVILNVTDTPLAYADGTVEYLVSFDFFQVDF